MSKVSGASGARAFAPVTVSFGDRFASSENFDRVFKEGMALVERTAAYLDGGGRREQKRLVPPLSVTYATESMRLTTRLLELASWLLIKRALRDGEITPDEASRKRAQIKLSGEGRASHVKDFGALPEGLQALITESFLLQDRIVQLDRAMADVAPVTGVNAVAAQIDTIERAFSRTDRRA
jgi:regulator of CtrA degradation